MLQEAFIAVAAGIGINFFCFVFLLHDRLFPRVDRSRETNYFYCFENWEAVVFMGFQCSLLFGVTNAGTVRV